MTLAPAVSIAAALRDELQSEVVRSREERVVLRSLDGGRIQARMEERLEFIEHPLWRTYVFVHAEGEALLARWLEAVPERERVDRFGRLLAVFDRRHREVLAARHAITAGPDFGSAGAALGIDADPAGLGGHQSLQGIAGKRLPDGLEHHVGFETHSLG